MLKERKYLSWMFLFFIMVVISVFLSSNFHKGLRYLDPRLPLAYFPLSVGLLQLKKEFKDKILLAFAWLTTSIMLLCLCWSLQRSGFFKKPEFLYNDSFTEILKQQSIYISLLVNLSIYIFSYHILYKKNRYKGRDESRRAISLCDQLFIGQPESYDGAICIYDRLCLLLHL